MVRHIAILSLLLAACETTEVAVISRPLEVGESIALRHLAFRQIGDQQTFPVAGELTKNGWVEFTGATIEVGANCYDGIRPLGGDPNAGLVCDQNGGPAVMVTERVLKRVKTREGEIWQYVFLPHVELNRVRHHAYTLVVSEMQKLTP